MRYISCLLGIRPIVGAGPGFGILEIGRKGSRRIGGNVIEFRGLITFGCSAATIATANSRINSGNAAACAYIPLRSYPFTGSFG